MTTIKGKHFLDTTTLPGYEEKLHDCEKNVLLLVTAYLRSNL